MAAKAANALYDPQFGWNPPARYQQERAWCEVVRKEKRIQVRSADTFPTAIWFKQGSISRALAIYSH